MTPAADDDRLRGLTFAKQFPSPQEPVRGIFTLEQVRASSPWVAWRVIAPVPWVPRALAGVLCRPYVRGADVIDGIRVDRPRYPVLPRRLLYTTVAPAMAICSKRAFGAAVREHAPAFVHAHALYPSGAAARRLCRAVGLPLIVSVHGSDLYSNLVRPAWEREVRRTLAAARTVICVSSSLARDVIALGEVEPDRVRVVPNTYDETRFRYVERPPGTGRTVRFVSTGSLVPVKGHDILIEAFAQAVRRGLDATLDIVGEGPERVRLERMIAERGLRERVRLLGRLTGDALIRALEQADAFVLASRREGFGVAIIEAMATGLPVVVTNAGGPSDIVTGEGMGVLVAPGDAGAFADAMVRVAHAIDAFDREAIARSIGDRYARERIGAMLVAIYREATGC